jgi:hypothetical protein
MDTTNQEQMNEFAGSLVLVMFVIITWEFQKLFGSDDINNTPAFL